MVATDMATAVMVMDIATGMVMITATDMATRTGMVIGTMRIGAVTTVVGGASLVRLRSRRLLAVDAGWLRLDLLLNIEEGRRLRSAPFPFAGRESVIWPWR